MAASLSVAHGFLPPYPGPTAIAVIFNADLGTTLIYGFIIAVPTVILAGPLYYNFVKDLKPEIPKGLYNPKIFKEDEMPSFAISIFTALVPVVLMAASAIVKMTLDDTYSIYHILVFLGNPDIALTFGLNRGKSMKEIMTSAEDAVKTIAMILLVVAGGGVLKQILIDSGLGGNIYR